MDLKINGGSHCLRGEVRAPPSKSYSHRAFIVASLANGPSTLFNPLTSGDVEITINILKELGVEIKDVSSHRYRVIKKYFPFKACKKVLDCKNSGTSIRIFSVISLLIEGGLTFTGEFLAKKRPIRPLLESLDSLGATYNLTDNILHVERVKESCKPISIQGDISSQFITALLITCPLIRCTQTDSIIINITSPLISYPYIKITEDVLTTFGGEVQEELKNDMTGFFRIPVNQELEGREYEIPGDFSSAAFLICAAVLSSKEQVIISNLDIANPQGDKRIIQILEEMGAEIEVDSKHHRVLINGNIDTYPLEGINIDCKDIPDLFPILSVVGSQARGKTTLYNAASLRLKESDRISVMARELRKMGVKVEEFEDKMIIHQCKELKGTEINHNNDHRIAMACTIAALRATTSTIIKNIEIVNDSYPNFTEHLKKLNAKIEIK
ncbi:MAG: 3-phosphoshikimate 1-carboxyvinyltransferase [Promethearchaeota archaeon]